MEAANKEVSAVEQALVNEYAYDPVPMEKRKSLLEVASVWMGFTMAASLAVLGGIVQAGVGVQNAIIAVLIGNLLLFLYSTGVGIISFRTGLNFSLVAQRSFGRKGYLLASLVLSALVLGWFAVQADMFGYLLATSGTVALPQWLMTFGLSLIFMTTALLGYRAMVYLSYLVIPSFLILGALASYRAFASSGLDFSYVPQNASMGMGMAISIVAASFIVSATLTGDFVRWARSTRDVIIVHFLAFVVGLSATMLFGVFLSASGQQTDIFTTLIALGLTIPAIIMTGINLWSTCDNCLYNASLGFSNQLSTVLKSKVSRRAVTLSLGIVGAAIAASGAFGQYDSWLIFLGTVVPPAGGIIMADYYLLNRHNREVVYGESYTEGPSFKWGAFLAWAVGIAAAYYLERAVPSIPAAYVGVIVGGGVYMLASRKA
jgi:cytosine permease